VHSQIHDAISNYTLLCSVTARSHAAAQGSLHHVRLPKLSSRLFPPWPRIPPPPVETALETFFSHRRTASAASDNDTHAPSRSFSSSDYPPQASRCSKHSEDQEFRSCKDVHADGLFYGSFIRRCLLLGCSCHVAWRLEPAAKSPSFPLPRISSCHRVEFSICSRHCGRLFLPSLPLPWKSIHPSPVSPLAKLLFGTKRTYWTLQSVATKHLGSVNS
jgi:hypothetical protein